MPLESDRIDSRERPIEAAVDLARQQEPMYTILQAVAVATNTPVSNLEPLVQTLDPDALDRLFPGDEESAGTKTELMFEYEGCTVTVSSNGTV